MQYYGKAKRKRTIALIISYIIMTLAVIALSVISIMLVLGYRFDLTSQSVERGALLQFASNPDGATITLDGKQLSSRTPTKQDVEVGAHQVGIAKSGYRPWSKQFTLRAGEVRWLNYARLVPTTITTNVVKAFPTLADELPAPDRGWIAVLERSDQAKINIIDIRDEKNLKYSEITVPNEILTLPEGSPHTFSFTEWDFGSRYLLVRHDFNGGHEYVRIDRSDPKNIVNISTKFGVVFADVHFSGGDAFYGVENGNLRRFDLGSSSISEPIARGVEQMKLYGSKDMAVVQNEAGQLKVSVVIDNKVTTVATYDATLPVLIDISKYFNERYVAIVRGSSFELIKNPEKSAGKGLVKVITLTYAGQVKWLDMSSNGRFVILGNSTNFMTYDIELARRTDTNLPGGSTESLKPLQWIDDFVLASTADNKLRFADFDGDNQQIITDTLPYKPVVLSQNNKVLFNFALEQDGTAALHSVKMTVE
jgi:hypothetical protein